MPPPTFDDAWTAYAHHLRRRRRFASTIEQYRIRLATWNDWLAQQGLDWRQASPDDLDRFLDRPCRPGAVHSGNGLALATKAVYGTSVPLFYHALYALKVLPQDRFAGYVAPAPPDPDPEPIPLRQVGQLLRHVHDHPDHRLEPLVGLGYFAGLRMGEISRLTVSSLKLAADPPRLLVIGKGRDQAVALPVHPALQPILGRYTYWLAGQAGVSSPRDLPAGTPLIQSRTRPGHGVGRSLPSRLVHQAMGEAGVEGRPHDLRRTYAHWIGQRTGHNLEALRCGLRHRGYGALKFYVEPTLGQVGAWVEQVPDPRESGA